MHLLSPSAQMQLAADRRRELADQLAEVRARRRLRRRPPEPPTAA